MNKALERTKTCIEMHITRMGSLDEKLTFPTEVFCLTEDMRYELCHGNEGEEKVSSGIQGENTETRGELLAGTGDTENNGNGGI